MTVQTQTLVNSIQGGRTRVSLYNIDLGGVVVGDDDEDR